MISFEEAYKIVTASKVRLEKEDIDFRDATGRVLATDVISDVDMPPFDKTAVDGFACRMEDLGMELSVIETIPAGKLPELKINRGECSRIMTGACIPVGSDCVVMVENTTETSDGKIKYKFETTPVNICRMGEDVRRGDVLLKPGTKLDSQHVAVLASAGCIHPEVFTFPVVAVISTGNELVEPWKTPSGGQIRNSNAFQLASQVARTGAKAKYYGIAEDDKAATYDIISKALRECSLILLTGGVSMGDFDYVPGVLDELGFETLFHSVAVQPGRPTVFSKKDDQYCFGLPGNPVSSFVQFEMLVKPLIYKMSGFSYTPLTLKLPLAADFSKKNIDRLTIVPVYINPDNTISATGYHGSAHIHALTEANGLMLVHPGISVIKKGEPADVRQI